MTNTFQEVFERALYQGTNYSILFHSTFIDNYIKIITIIVVVIIARVPSHPTGNGTELS